MIDPETKIETGTLAALAPFDESRDVRPYRVHLDHAGLLRMATHYCIKAADHHALSAKIQDWTLHYGGVDADGLYYLCTYNPDGRFDWYEIGGRWEGYLNGQNTMNAGSLARDSRLKKRLPYCILNPDGEWIQRQHSYVVGEALKTERMSEAAWLKKVKEQLDRWPRHQVVCVDIHC